MQEQTGLDLVWLGHATWLVESDTNRLLIDPFLQDSPTAPCTADDLDVDHILITHGHEDHIADAARIAQRCHAKLIAIHEIAAWFREKHQLADAVGMNRGGWMTLPFGRIKMTVAFHSSSLPEGSPGGEAAGYVVEIAQQRLYFAGDTALFSDMQLIGNLGLDAAIIPIGDWYTMGIDDSIQAVHWLRPRKVFPSHYNTWPPIAQDAGEWAARIRAETNAEPYVPQPGDRVQIVASRLK